MLDDGARGPDADVLVGVVEPLEVGRNDQEGEDNEQPRGVTPKGARRDPPMDLHARPNPPSRGRLCLDALPADPRRLLARGLSWPEPLLQAVELGLEQR